ncbi:MAG: GntR family transcriptional regulator [Solirubrobacterales bacterium]|nr:GntR family transcriptional regulator [Solirubrobacterales bacterium]
MSALAEIGAEARTLRAQVLNAVRAAVVSGELAPGARISETELARGLGVSRGTLREAVRRLEQEGLLVTLSHRGTFVRELSAEEIVDVYGVRFALEGYAARCASPRLTPEVRALLHDRIDELAATVRGADFREAIAADLRFHEAVCAVSGNRFLLDQWRSMVGLIAAVMHTAGPDLVRPLQSPDEHRELLASVESGDAARIDATWRAHFDSGAETLGNAVRRRDALAGPARRKP